MKYNVLFVTLFLQRLKQFPQKVLQSQGLKGRRFTFLCGDSGPLVTAFMMTNDAKDRAKLLNRYFCVKFGIYVIT